MDGNQPLFDDLYREKIRQARTMTPEERVLASFDLTDFALKVMAAGVRAQFPEAGEEEVQRIVCRNVQRVRRMENLSRCEPKT